MCVCRRDILKSRVTQIRKLVYSISRPTTLALTLFSGVVPTSQANVRRVVRKSSVLFFNFVPQRDLVIRQDRAIFDGSAARERCSDAAILGGGGEERIAIRRVVEPVASPYRDPTAKMYYPSRGTRPAFERHW